MKPQPTALSRYIAFLRAINVGGHTVKMDQLRTLFVELELSNVATFIASGNVIFESPSTDMQVLEKQIESHLRQALGYDVATFIRSASDLATIVNYQPFAPAKRSGKGESLYIAFLSASPKPEAREKLMAFRSDVDDFHVHAREVYWLCRTRLSESAFSGARLEKALGMQATMRNSTTVKKLAAKYAAAL